jgi:cysteine-rich repeat protein
MTGACPTACDDGDRCTVDTLKNAGTCNAACSFVPVATGLADGCCPPGATLKTDQDCPIACGDGVVSAGEQCDDGNTTDGDGCHHDCTFEPIAFRADSLNVRDPHIFATVPILGCTDVTDLSLFGINGVNPQINTKITMDGDGNGLLDLSLAETFTPLDQVAGDSVPTDVVFPDCTSPIGTTSCTLPATATHTPSTAKNQGTGTCLGTINGTTGGYNPKVVTPAAPAGGTCYVANIGTAAFNLGGIAITLRDTSVAGVWFGSPATKVQNGLIRGFLSEADADATIIPVGLTGISSIDGQPLSSLLRGGTSCCSKPAPAVGDKDTYLDPVSGMTLTGWYFYLNFTSTKVPYTAL